MLRIAIVAGETSGDQLGAGLIRAVRARIPDVQFVGVAGPAMTAEGCEGWFDSAELGVMGLSEVISHLPRLFRIRSDLRRRILAERPDLFVGIDVPDFNLPLAKQLKSHGLATVQYVSPQVWAWRSGRVRRMKGVTDLVLCLFPFEKAFYDKHDISAEFVGHPLADAIADTTDRQAARHRLKLPRDGPLVAILPGSRDSEVRRLGPDFAAACEWIHQRRNHIGFVGGMADETTAGIFRSALERQAVTADIPLISGRTREVLSAADVVLLSSGTATLEAALIKRPMVVAYRVSPVTRWLVETFRLVDLEHYALPNLLIGRDLVPEIMQDAISPAALGSAVLNWLDDESAVTGLVAEFSRLHDSLRCSADDKAARALVKLMRTEVRES